jgi:magnesium and cobalt transporter
MSWLITALQLGVAPILAAVTTLWAALVAMAAESEAGLPRLLVPPISEAGQLSPARSLHVVRLALLAMGAFLAGLGLSWWAWPFPVSLVRFLLAVALVWVVGDLLPRLWAANEPSLVRPDGRIATFSLAAFGPILRLVAWADRGGRSPRGEEFVRLQLPDPSLRDRLSGVFSLHEMTVAEVMTPRMDVISVDLSATRSQLLDTFQAAEHSRLLVVDGDPDNVVGVIYAKDLLKELAGRPEDADWHRLVRPVDYVPDAKRLDRQLRDFQRGSAHLAVVADEFGGTSGIVTMEDVLEQIVGEIRDERDADEAVPILRAAGGEVVVLGNVPLVDLEAELDTSFGREDVGTVGGLVLAIAGRVPRVGETLTLGDYSVTIDQIVRRRVGRVTFRRAAPVPALGGDGGRA